MDNISNKRDIISITFLLTEMVLREVTFDMMVTTIRDKNTYTHIYCSTLLLVQLQRVQKSVKNKKVEIA